MRIRRVFVPPEGISGRDVEFPSKVVHYLTKVLRIDLGEEVEAFDGRYTHRVRLLGCEKRGVRGEILRTSPAEPHYPCQITLAFGCVRPGPFEEILRHCTELGVCRFVPILTSRTARRPDTRKNRWDAVVAAAAAQAGRATLPAVEAPTTLDTFLRQERKGLKLILSTEPEATPLLGELQRSPFSQLVVLVGPEGGFEQTEEDRARTNGFSPVSLGLSRLRTETAAVVAVGAAALWFSSHRSAPGTYRDDRA